LDPGAVDTGAVPEAQRAVDRAPLVPPVAADDLRGQGLTEPLEHPVDNVQVVKEAAEEALAEGAHDVLAPRAHRLLDLLGLLAADALDHAPPPVPPPYDLPPPHLTLPPPLP